MAASSRWPSRTPRYRPRECACCGETLSDSAPGRAFGGYDEIDLIPADPKAPGLGLSVTRHLPFEVSCGCGHRTRYRPPRIGCRVNGKARVSTVNKCSARVFRR